MGHEPGAARERTRKTGPYASLVRAVENLGEAAFAYVLLVPTVLILGVIALWPLLRTFEMSLHADILFGNQAIGEYVGFRNYVELLTGQRAALLVRAFLPDVSLTGSFPFVDVRNIYTSALTVTLVFTVVSVAFETLIGFGQALVLNQEFRGRRWVRVAIIIPWAVPIVIQGMIFYLLFQPGIGFLLGTQANPTLLQQWGLVGFTPLSSSAEALAIIVVADIWKTSAFMALLILAGLQSVDRELYDVARVSGASRWQQFRYVTFPLVLPAVLVAMLFRTIDAVRIFGLIETVAGCSTVPSLSCLVVTTFNQRRYGSASTIAFVTAAIIAIAVSVYIVKFADTRVGGQ